MEINQAFTILQSAGGVRAARVITENTPNLTRLKIWCMARKLRRGVPVAKIIHQKWFYGLKFYTNKYTLDPRPDTETLVAAVIADCDTDNKRTKILDLGTGTGCIIAALVKNIHGACGVAIEKSWQARRVARKNIKKLNLTDCVTVQAGDFTSPDTVHDTFDVIVSNPPYIAFGDSRVDIGASHDPKMALYANENGLAAYKAIAKNAKNWIKRNGKIYLEIGAGQSDAVRDIFTTQGWVYVRTECDLGGIPRVMVLQNA